MWKKFISRKLIVTLLGIITLAGAPIPTETASWIADIIMLYLGGQSVVDAAEKYRNEV